MIDEFIVYGRRTADPWHRMNCCQQPAFVFIEFCQVIGPKPLYWCPKQVGPHLDLDQVALWVMSSENLHASITCMYNQQLGLYALSIYSTIFDLSARAFQRPFALVLLSNVKPNPTTVQFFQEKCVRFLRPFLACNRQHFENVMEHLINIEENIYSANFDNYYKLLSNTTRLPSKSNLIRGLQLAAIRANMGKTKIQIQAKCWYGRAINRKNIYVKNGDAKCDCGIEMCEFEKFLPFIAEHSLSSHLMPIVEMAPCITESFVHSFSTLYHDLVAVVKPKGVLFANHTPILRSVIGANFSYIHEEYDSGEESIKIVSKKAGQFRNFSSAFINVVAHLFAGERIAVLASAQKATQGIELMRKLNALRISKRFKSATWYDNQAERNISGEKQLVGFVCNSSDSPDWMHPNYPVVIDLNFMRVKCRKYVGRFLRPLANTMLRQFPSDESVLKLLTAVLTDVQQFTVIAKYISPRTLMDRLNMSPADQLIFVNNLVEMDVVKFSFLKTHIEEHWETSQLRQIRL